MWGFSPLQNDIACDWLEDLIHDQEFLLRVEQGLGEEPEVVRAAAAWIHQLAANGFWPHDSRERLVLRSIAGLEGLLNRGAFTHPHVIANVQAEIGGLRGLLRSPGVAAKPSLD